MKTSSFLCLCYLPSFSTFPSYSLYLCHLFSSFCLIFPSILCHLSIPPVPYLPLAYSSLERYVKPSLYCFYHLYSFICKAFSPFSLYLHLFSFYFHSQLFFPHLHIALLLPPTPPLSHLKLPPQLWPRTVPHMTRKSRKKAKSFCRG